LSFFLLAPVSSLPDFFSVQLRLRGLDAEIFKRVQYFRGTLQNFMIHFRGDAALKTLSGVQHVAESLAAYAQFRIFESVPHIANFGQAIWGPRIHLPQPTALTI
jgi:hypothetical protein